MICRLQVAHNNISMQSTKKSEYLTTFLFSIFCFTALIIKWGYEFGRGDQVEILPYSMILHGNTILQNDFFYQSIINIFPNERWFLALLLSYFGKQTELIVFILHCTSTLLLIIGLEKVGFILIKNRLFTRLSIFLTLIIFYYYYNLGGNELYYNNLQGSTLAKSIGIWGIYCMLKEKYALSSFLFFFSLLFQPLVGFQLQLCLILVYFFNSNNKKFKLTLSHYILSLSLFLCFLYIGVIQFAYYTANQGFPNTDFSQIIFRFRNGHHYMPNQFQMNGWILISICFITSIYFFWKNKIIKTWLLASLVIIIFYLIGLYFNITPIISIQAFKLTIWIKYFGILSCIGVLLRWFKILTKLEDYNNFQSVVYFGGIIICLIFINFAPSNLFPDNRLYDFGNQTKTDDAIKISMLAKKETQTNALFIVPSNFTEITYYGQRSCYVSDKANPKYPKAASEWAKRIQLIYGLNYIDLRPKWWLANTNYELIVQSANLNYNQLGITHIICKSKLTHGEKLVSTSGEYKLYSLRN